MGGDRERVGFYVLHVRSASTHMAKTRKEGGGGLWGVTTYVHGIRSASVWGDASRRRRRRRARHWIKWWTRGGGGGGDVASAGTKGGMKMGLAGWVRVGVMASTARAEHGGGEGHCLA